ncbi:MAG: STAS domain-containing protein [Chloroflexi bacterium]|nr:STAS domain-containing protein [Chloroflexota bacterium]
MLEITVTHNQGPAPVAVLQLQGSLDGSTYEKFIAKAKELYASGARNLLLDLRELTFLSSAGIASLHRVALLFRGKPVDEDDEGWDAYRAIDRDRNNGSQERVKLYSPSESVRRVLELVGFTDLFDIYTDTTAALASFPAAIPAG